MLEYSGDTRSGIIGFPKNTIGSFYVRGSNAWNAYSAGTHITAFDTVPNGAGERGPGMNIGGCWDTSNHKYTAPTTGVYIFEVRLYHCYNQNYASAAWRLNGAGSAIADQGDGFFVNYNASNSDRDNVEYMSMRMRLNAGDYVQLHAVGVCDVHGTQSGLGGYLWQPEVHNTTG